MAQDEIDKRIRDAARDWHVIMRSGDADRETRAEFEAWLHADRTHKRAYRAFEQLYRDLEIALPRAGVDADAIRRRTGRPTAARLKALLSGPQWAGGLAAAASVVIAFFFIAGDRFEGRPDRPVLPSYSTEIAEVSEITLEDGSVITLGAKSMIETEFTAAARHVNLLAGEAFFDVAKDAERPFYVTADETLVRVVGTRFDVKAAGAKIHVAVLEGVVEVMRPENISQPLDADIVARAGAKQVLTAGERLVAARNDRTLPSAQIMELGEAGAWRSGRLAYEDARLSEIVADLNRYHQRQIRLASPGLRDLRLTATFGTTDLDEVIEMVESIYPIDADYSRDDRITLRPRPNAG